MKFFLFIFIILSLTGESAQAAPSRDDVFVPTSGWLVGPSSPAPAPTPAPCVMADQFDNGFLIRFSGGGKRLLALALDVHQQAFTPGQPYLISLGIGDRPVRSVSAQAYDGSTLLVDLRAAPDAYDAANGGRILHMIVAGKSLDFALLGMEDGLRRLEACYSGSAAGQQAAFERVPPISMSSSAVSSLAPSSMGIDPGYRNAVGDGEAAPVNAAPVETAQDGAGQAEAMGMHSLTSPRQPAGASQIVSRPNAPSETAVADTAGPPGFIDQILQKAASGLHNMSGGTGVGLQDAVTPQAPRSATVTNAARSLNGDDTPLKPETVAPASGPAGVQTVNGPLAGNWTSSVVRRDSQGRDVIAGANRSVPYTQDRSAVQATPPSPFRQPGGQNVGPDAQARLQALNYALPQ